MGFARIELKLKVEQEEEEGEGKVCTDVICLCVVPSERRLKQSQGCQEHLMWFLLLQPFKLLFCFQIVKIGI